MPVGRNKDRKYDTIVAKSPSLLLCKHTMSLTEKKLFDLSLVTLKKDYESPGGVLKIPEGKQVEVKIPAKEIKETLGLTSTNIYTKLYEIAENYTKIKFALKKDPTSSDVDDSAFEMMVPFPYCKYEKGVWTMRFESGLNKEISNLDAGNYALSDTAITSKFTRKASSDLYDIITWYKWKGGFTISISEFRTLLGLDMEVKDEQGNIKKVSKYANYKRLNALIIKPGIEEINQLSDIIVTVETIKERNSVKYLKFSWTKKVESVTTESGQEVILASNPLGEIDEDMAASARILKMIITDPEISENDVLVLLMTANGDQEVVIEKWQLYRKQKMTTTIDKPVGWIISAIKNNYKGNIEDVDLKDVVEVGPATNEDNEDVLDSISELLRNYEKPFKLKDIRAIAKQAGNDVSKVEKAYKVLNAQKNIEDHVAYMIAAIRDDYEPPKRTKKEKSNEFNEFQQRQYSEADYVELERRKLNKL